MADGLRMNIKIDQKAKNFFQREAPQKLREARGKAVEAAGMVWADEAKSITRADNHIDTGLFVNSIGINTGSPASESDVIHDISERGSKTVLRIGSNVAYASTLEKRYNIMARALDSSEARMSQAAQTQIKKLFR